MDPNDTIISKAASVATLENKLQPTDSGEPFSAEKFLRMANYLLSYGSATLAELPPEVGYGARVNKS